MGLSSRKPARPVQSSTSPTPFEEVYEQTVGAAEATLRAYGVREPHQVDDALQAVFLVVLEALGRGTNPRNAKSWVMAIAYNVARHHRRRRAVESARIDDAADVARVAAPDAEAERSERAQHALVLSLVEQIRSEKQREVVIRYYLAEQPIEDIAAELDRPEPTVVTQLHAGRRAMKAALVRHMARERRRTGGAVVVPILGVDGMLEALRHIRAPAGLSARVWGRLEDLPEPCGGGGGGPTAPAMPSGGPVAGLERAAPPWSWKNTALALVGAMALVEAGIIVSSLRDQHGAPVEALPDAVVATVIASAAPDVGPAPSAAPFASASSSSKAIPASPWRDLSGTDLNAERNVVMGVEEALREHRIDDARAAIEDHARRWPGGGRLAPRLRALVERYAAELRRDPQVDRFGAQSSAPR